MLKLVAIPVLLAAVIFAGMFGVIVHDLREELRRTRRTRRIMGNGWVVCGFGLAATTFVVSIGALVTGIVFLSS